MDRLEAWGVSYYQRPQVMPDDGYAMARSSPAVGASSFSLDGRVALVTGGSRGIGRALAIVLAQAGAKVVVTARTVAACEAVVADIESLGGGGGRASRSRRPRGGRAGECDRGT
jgi:hypothetical protein